MRRPWLACLLLVLVAGTTAADEKVPDLAEIVGALRHLVADEAWDVTTERISKSKFSRMLGGVAREEVEAASEGYRGGHDLVARLPFERPVLFATAFAFDTEPRAKRFLQAARKAIDELELPGGSPKPTVEDGVSALPGFRFGFEQKMADFTFVGQGLFLHRGRIVVRLIVGNAPCIDRKVQAAAAAYADAFIRDPGAARKLKAPPTPEVPLWDRRLLRVRVLDPEGKPVPLAEVAGTAEVDIFRWEHGRGTCRDGRCTLRVPKKEGFVRVWHARSADGTPLKLAATSDVEYGADDAEVVVTLRPGHAIAGRVLGADGKPAAGVTVKARSGPDMIYGNRDRGLRIRHAEAVSDADGRFRLEGLRDEEYELELERDGKPATAAEFEFDAGRADVELRLQATAKPKKR